MKAATRPATGFGIALEDLDNDGWTDLVQLNGHVLDRERLGIPFRMQPTLLRNRGAGSLEAASASAGEWFLRPRLGRGLVWGDLDDDGRIDLVAQALEEPVAVLWNESPPAHWLDVKFANGAAAAVTTWPIGGQVVVTAGGRARTRSVTSGSSYASSSSRSLHFGLGSAQIVDTLEVRWPDGRTWRRRGVAVDRALVIPHGD